MTEPKLEHQIEAILFAATTPLDLGELAEATDAPLLEVDQALKRLQKTWDRRKGAIEIAETMKGYNPAYLLQVRPDYTDTVTRFRPPELPAELLETLGLIALNQPLVQAELARERGPRAYVHIRELEERGLIRRHPKGRTFTLRTTPDFADMFGLEDDPATIRRVLKAG